MNLPYRAVVIPVWRRGAVKGAVTLSAVVDDSTSEITGVVLDVPEGVEGTIKVSTLGVTFARTLTGTASSETFRARSGLSWGTIRRAERDYVGPLKDGVPAKGVVFHWVNPDGVLSTTERAIREAQR